MAAPSSRRPNFDAIKKVDDWIFKAYKAGASDVHIEPQAKKLRIRARIDGQLQHLDSVSEEHSSAIATRLKVMAKLNVNERRLPQDGRFNFEHYQVKNLDLRINTNPVIYGEKIVLRLIDQSKLRFTLEDLGFSPKNLKRYKSCLYKPHGLILHVGPTGSGKTTTLYTAIQEVNNPDKNIHTVEDPVEYTLEGISQSQVNHKIGFIFPVVLRALLRQDPDIIMIGEIRDMETAEIAVEAAMTGHLILSTLHTNDAVSTISRLQEMGVASCFLAYALLCIVSQRFVRKLCSCRKAALPDTKFLQTLPLDPQLRYYSPMGCQHCDRSGYKGRMAIMELLTVNKEMQNAINDEIPRDQLREIACRAGMSTILADGMEKAGGGHTSLEEVLRITGGQQESSAPKATMKLRVGAPPTPRRQASPSPAPMDVRRVIVRAPKSRSQGKNDPRPGGNLG
jgi:type IV pilus assembly protein PilB